MGRLRGSAGARRTAISASVVGLALLAASSEAAITLEMRVDAAVRADVRVHVGVTNLGDEGAEDAVPEVTLLGTTVRGAEPAAVPPQFTAAWDLTVPRPTALGTLPIVVQLHYADGFGHRMSAPAVHVLRTAGAPDGRVVLAIDATPVVASGTVTVRIANREDAPVSGTLGLVPSTELVVTPIERPVEIAPGADLTVPVHVENRGALEGSTTAVWAWLTIQRATHVETLAAGAAVPVVAPPDPKARTRILLTLAGVSTVVLLGWAIRRLLASPAPPTRAERRRR